MNELAWDEMATNLKHPVFEIWYANRFVFIPKEHKHHFQTPTFWEMVGRQIKLVAGDIKNGRTPQIRKIEVSRDLLWELMGCIGN